MWQLAFLLKIRVIGGGMTIAMREEIWLALLPLTPGHTHPTLSNFEGELLMSQSLNCCWRLGWHEGTRGL